MKAFPKITLSETTRRRLGFSCAGLNLLCIIASVVLVILGIYTEISVQKKVSLIKNYNGHYLPGFMIAVGVVSLALNVFGWKMCLDSRDIPERPRRQKLLLAYVTMASIVSVIVEVSGILCFVHRYQLHSAFSDGLKYAMKKYRTDQAIKEEFDLLQMKYRCCGNTAYTDWFSVSWISKKYVDTSNANIKRKMSTGKFLNDDVPFSCCNMDAPRPCIHHHVHDNNLHYDYDYRRNTTLNELGCKQALTEFYGNKLLKNVGIVVMVISVLQGIVCTAARFLQTSITYSISTRDPRGPAPGWILAFGPLPTVSETKMPPDQQNLLAESDFSDDGFASDEFDDCYSIDEPIYSNVPMEYDNINEPIYENIDQYQPDGTQLPITNANQSAFIFSHMAEKHKPRSNTRKRLSSRSKFYETTCSEKRSMPIISPPPAFKDRIKPKKYITY